MAHALTTRRLSPRLVSIGSLVCFAAAAHATAPADKPAGQAPGLRSAAPSEVTYLLPGGVPLVLVRIPKGTFSMGSPDSERGRSGTEGPQHQVTISQDYYIGKYEVTQRQWIAVMGSNPSYFAYCGLDCPVEQVRWNEVCGGSTGSDCTASSFIGKVNQLLGKYEFRLPTEAEWERAVRGGTAGPFSFDIGWDPTWDTDCGSFPEALPFMWWCNNAGSTPHKVALRQANPYGIHDMHGNIAEWVADWYQGYSSEAVTDPQGPVSGSSRVWRGGSFSTYARGCRSAARGYDSPAARTEYLGFRVAMSSGALGPSLSYWVPVASRADGVGGSSWRTDVGLLNVNNADAEVTFVFYDASGPRQGTLTVPPNVQWILNDVVGQIGGAGNGPLEVLSDRPLEVTSRTYTLNSLAAACYPGGTLGQKLDVVALGEGLAAGEQVWLPQLTEDASYRTNIGVTNTGTTDASVRVRLFDGSGALLGSYTLTLLPHQWKQDRAFFTRAGVTNMARGYAQVEVLAGNGIVAYASIVDNVTNDPTTITTMP